jgi:gluconate kinase
MEEESGEIQEVATLATMCTNLKREDRPTMREVEMTLGSLLLKKRQVQYNRTPMRNGGDEATAHYMAIVVIARKLAGNTLWKRKFGYQQAILGELLLQL